MLASADFINNSGAWIIHGGLDCYSGKAVAHAAVVNYRKWVTTQPMQ